VGNEARSILPFAPRTTTVFFLAAFEGAKPPSLPAFCAKEASTALLAASPYGVAPNIATKSAVTDRMIGVRCLMCSFLWRHIGPDWSPDITRTRYREPYAPTSPHRPAQRRAATMGR
jgi:hypothetical protein